MTISASGEKLFDPRFRDWIGTASMNVLQGGEIARKIKHSLECHSIPSARRCTSINMLNPKIPKSDLPQPSAAHQQNPCVHDVRHMYRTNDSAGTIEFVEVHNSDVYDHLLREGYVATNMRVVKEITVRGSHHLAHPLATNSVPPAVNFIPVERTRITATPVTETPAADSDIMRHDQSEVPDLNVTVISFPSTHDHLSNVFKLAHLGNEDSSVAEEVVLKWEERSMLGCSPLKDWLQYDSNGTAELTGAAKKIVAVLDPENSIIRNGLGNIAKVYLYIQLCKDFVISSKISAGVLKSSATQFLKEYNSGEASGDSKKTYTTRAKELADARNLAT